MGMVIPTREFAYVILILLLLFSLVSWTIMVRKWLTFRRIEHQSRGFVAIFRKSARLSEVSQACEHYRGTPLSGIFTAAYQELNAQLQTVKGNETGNPGHPVLSERSLGGIQRSCMPRRVDRKRIVPICLNAAGPVAWKCSPGIH